MKIIYFLLIASALLVSCNKNNSSVDTPPVIIQNYEVVLDPSPAFVVGNNLGIVYYNDITVGVLNYDYNNVRLITAVGNSTNILEGTSLSNITSTKTVLTPTILNNPSNTNAIDYNYIGLGQVIKGNDNIFYGLYHAEWHDGTTLIGNIPGFYASIGLSISSDGINFSKSTKEVIPNIESRSFQTGYAARGFGEPSLTFNADSTAVYCYFVDHNHGNTCMVKFATFSKGIPDFSTCYYLNSSNQFTKDLIHPKQVITCGTQKDAINAHVTYNKLAKKYFMVYNNNSYGEYNGTNYAGQSGIYFTTSDDGITWNNPSTQLISDLAIPFSTTNSFSWHPNLIYTNAEQTDGYLLYSHSSKGIAIEPHKMYAKKFSLVLK